MNMGLYFARVQLKGDPTAEQYETLHKRMSDIGFETKIQTANGIWELPHATYAVNNYVNANVASNADIYSEAVRCPGKWAPSSAGSPATPRMKPVGHAALSGPASRVRATAPLG
jgi:hypothetical protein